LFDSYKPNTGDLEGNQKIYKDFQEIMDPHLLSDCMAMRYDLGVSFKIGIPESEDWDNVPS
jgi:hypothetical protein